MKRGLMSLACLFAILLSSCTATPQEQVTLVTVPTNATSALTVSAPPTTASIAATSPTDTPLSPTATQTPIPTGTPTLTPTAAATQTPQSTAPPTPTSIPPTATKPPTPRVQIQPLQLPLAARIDLHDIPNDLREIAFLPGKSQPIRPDGLKYGVNFAGLHPNTVIELLRGPEKNNNPYAKQFAGDVIHVKVAGPLQIKGNQRAFLDIQRPDDKLPGNWAMEESLIVAKVPPKLENSSDDRKSIYQLLSIGTTRSVGGVRLVGPDVNGNYYPVLYVVNQDQTNTNYPMENHLVFKIGEKQRIRAELFEDEKGVWIRAFVVNIDPSGNKHYTSIGQAPLDKDIKNIVYGGFWQGAYTGNPVDSLEVYAGEQEIYRR